MSNYPVEPFAPDVEIIPSLRPELDAAPRRLDLWGLCLRNRWVIAACVAAVGALTALYTVRAPRKYEASASIRIDDRLVSLPGIEPLQAASDLTTEMEMLKSRTLAEQVARELRLAVEVEGSRDLPRSSLLSAIEVSDTADSVTYRVRPEDDGRIAVLAPTRDSALVTARPGSTVTLPGASLVFAPAAARFGAATLRFRRFETTAEDLRRAVKVSRAPNDANIILVRYRGSDPELVKNVVNAIARDFIAGRQDAQRSEARSRVSFLREQLDTLSAQLLVSEDELRKFRERAGTVNLDEESSSQVKRLAQMQADRAQLNAEAGALRNLLVSVKADAAAAKVDGPSPYRRLIAFPTLLRNPATSELLRSLATVEDERATLLIRRTPDDPDVQILTERVRQLDEQLRSIGVTYLQGLTDQTASIDSTLRAYGSQIERIPKTQVEVARLERGPKVLGEMYALLQTRLKEAQIAQAAIDPTVRIVDPAILPDRPVSPKPVVNMLAAVGLALALGLGVGVVRDWRDRSVHTRADVMSVTGVPVMGLIPRIPGMRAVSARLRGDQRVRKRPLPGPSFGAPKDREVSAAVEPLLVSAAKDRGLIAEAFGRLQTHVAFARPGSAVKVLLFTSPLSGDGKTTTAANFALSLARRGRRVLLIDADLRRGVVNRLFGVRRAPGLSEVLKGTVALESAIRQVDVGSGRQLDYLTTGALPADRTGTMPHEAFAAMLEHAEPLYDLVILDSAPVNVVSDAALLAAQADGVLLVARSGVTAFDALAYAIEQLRSVGAPLLGAVLNDIDFRRDAPFDRSYRYYGHADPYFHGQPK